MMQATRGVVERASRLRLLVQHDNGNHVEPLFPYVHYRLIGNFYQLCDTKATQAAPMPNDGHNEALLQSLEQLSFNFGIPLKSKPVYPARLSTHKISAIVTVFRHLRPEVIQKRLKGIVISGEMPIYSSRQPAAVSNNVLYFNPNECLYIDDANFLPLVLHELGHIFDGFWLSEGAQKMKFNPENGQPLKIGEKIFAPNTPEEIRALLKRDLPDIITHPDFVCDFTICYVLLGDKLRQYVHLKEGQGYFGIREFYNLFRDTIFSGVEFIDAE